MVNIDHVKRELGVCGIANIPNQIHHLASFTRLSFNILLMGELNTGKTAFVNRLLGGQVFKAASERADREQFAMRCQPQTDKLVIRVREQDIVENESHATVRIIDAPQIGFSVGKDIGFGALCDYARDRMDDHLKYDRSTCRAQPEYKDQRVHVCLYFLTPRQLELSPTDMRCLRSISQYTNVILVAGKADMMTRDELDLLSIRALSACAAANIKVFVGPSSSGLCDEASPCLFPISTRPGAIAQAKPALEGLLIKAYLPKLVDSTHDVHFENYRTMKYATVVSKRSASLDALGSAVPAAEGHFYNHRNVRA